MDLSPFTSSSPIIFQKESCGAADSGRTKKVEDEDSLYNWQLRLICGVWLVDWF